MNIRYANIENLPSLLPLFIELGYPVTLDDLTVRFQRFLQNAGYGVAICESDHYIAGWIAWSRSYLIVSDATRFHIEGLIVANNCRGKGIGKKLIEFVEEIARKNNPAIVDLVSGVRRASEGSHKFYENLGYKNEGEMAKIYLRKTL